MKKTNNIIKLNGTSNYFPQIEATVEELLPMYYYGFVTPSTLKALVMMDQLLINWCLTINPQEVTQNKPIKRTFQDGWIRLMKSKEI